MEEAERATATPNRNRNHFAYARYAVHCQDLEDSMFSVHETFLGSWVTHYASLKTPQGHHFYKTRLGAATTPTPSSDRFIFPAAPRVASLLVL